MKKIIRPSKIGIKKIDRYLCIGCGTCVRSCQCDVIRMREGKASIAYPYDCVACLACENDCPTGAITIALVE